MITTSTIGIGHGYDEHLLAEIAAGGNGNDAFATDADGAGTALAGEIECLLGKTVQTASMFIATTGDVAGVSLPNQLHANAVDGGIMVELGDFYSGEQRKLLLEMTVPAMAGLGLAQIPTLTLSYVELPALEQHTVALPVSVNVVPADMAAGRVAAPEVEREKLILTAQRAKRASEEALRHGDYDQARQVLSEAAATLLAAPPAVGDEEVREEAAWLTQSHDGLQEWAVE